MCVEYMNAVLGELKKRALPENVPGKVIAQEHREKTAVYEGTVPM